MDWTFPIIAPDPLNGIPGQNHTQPGVAVFKQTLRDLSNDANLNVTAPSAGNEYDLVTAASVESFQRDWGLAEDPQLNWVTANQLYWIGLHDFFTKTFRRGVRGSAREVGKLQQWLYDLDPRQVTIQQFYGAELNRHVGQNTANAIYNYKRTRGLTPDRVANPATLQHIHREKFSLASQALAASGTVLIGGQPDPSIQQFRARVLTPVRFRPTSEDFFVLLVDAGFASDGTFATQFGLPLGTQALPVALGIGFQEYYLKPRPFDDDLSTGQTTTQKDDFAVPRYTLAGKLGREGEGDFTGDNTLEIRAYELDIDADWKVAPSPITLTPNTPVRPDINGAFELHFEPKTAPDFEGRDVIVRAVDEVTSGQVHVRVHAASPTLYNLSTLEVPIKLTLPPAGAPLPPELQLPGSGASDSQFEQIETRIRDLLQGSGGRTIGQLADEFADLSDTEREQLLEHLTAEAFLRADRPVRPGLNSPDFETESRQYAVEVKQLLLTESIKVERLIRAYALEPLFEDAFRDDTTFPGFALELRLPDDSKLVLNFNESLTSGEVTKVPKEVLYALLPDVHLDLTDEAAQRMIVVMPTQKQGEMLEKAVRSNHVQLTQDQINEALIALAELRQALRTPPEWVIDIDDLADPEQGLVKEWLTVDDPEIDIKLPLATKPDGQLTIEWRTLTLGVFEVARGLHQALNQAAQPAAYGDLIEPILRVRGVDDPTLRAAIRAEVPADPADIEHWPSQFKDPVHANVPGKIVEFLRGFLPYDPASGGADDDILALSLGQTAVATGLRALTYQPDGGGALQPVEDPAHLRRVADGDPENGGANTLFGKLLEVAQTDNPDGREWWKDWPEQVQGADAEQSALLFFRHIRRQQPSIGTALEAFFAAEPSFSLADAVPAADEPRILRACAEDAAFATQLVERLTSLHTLWDLTRDAVHFPKSRSEAIEWLVEQDKTTAATVGALTDAEIDVLQAQARVQQAVRNGQIAGER